MLTRQLVDLAPKLPEYKENISEKLQAFHTPKGGASKKFSETIEDLKKERLLEEYAREVTEEISLHVPAPTSTAAA